MSAALTSSSPIIRTERGLTLAGTRITLYDVMDYLAAGWPPSRIAERLRLSSEQLFAALTYIDQHRAAVEAEHEAVVAAAAESRQYWEERNRERLEPSAGSAPCDGTEALREKLRKWKSRPDQTA